MKRKVTQITVGEDAENPTVYRKNNIGRNDPCLCGSGKKAKNCCGTAPVYTYHKLHLYVTPEESMKKKWPIPFSIGEIVLLSDKFPVEECRGNKAIITRRGMEEYIGTFYFQIRPAEDTDLGKYDTKLWYADGHLERIEK